MQESPEKKKKTKKQKQEPTSDLASGSSIEFTGNPAARWYVELLHEDSVCKIHTLRVFTGKIALIK